MIKTPKAMKNVTYIKIAEGKVMVTDQLKPTVDLSGGEAYPELIYQNEIEEWEASFIEVGNKEFIDSIPDTELLTRSLLKTSLNDIIIAVRKNLPFRNLKQIPLSGSES